MRRRAAVMVPVLLLAVGLTACGSDAKTAPPAAAPKSSVGTNPESTAVANGAISIKDFAFSPKTVTVKVGTTVKVSNDDDTSHTWTLDDGSFDSDTLKSGDEVEHAFAKAGTFSFHCKIHSSMKGTVEVSS